jgi:hypothetical protein
MAKTKNRLVAIIGIVVGILTLRRVRKRSKKSRPRDIDHEDLDTASGHAAAAADHAKLAAEKAVEERKKKA